MDISGEHQNDITHDILRTRLDTHGKPIEEGKKGLTGEANEVAKVKGAGSGYCGDCYGGEPAEGSRCCNTCDEVRDAYVRKGWSFGNPDGIEQCVAEHWSEKIKEQNKEGCNIRGLVHVNKVVGNFHMSPGKAFQSNSMHVHDLVPYLAGTGAEHHDFGHVIKHFSFGSDAEYHMSKVRGSSKLESNGVKEKLKIKDPLEGLRAHTEESQFMFQVSPQADSVLYSCDGRSWLKVSRSLLFPLASPDSTSSRLSAPSSPSSAGNSSRRTSTL